MDNEKKKVNLGSVEKIPIGQGTCFIIDKVEVAVLRPRTGGLFALQNRCPHRQASLCDGIIDQRLVVCPYHGHKFDLRTGQGSEPKEQLKIYEVSEENGEIWLEI